MKGYIPSKKSSFQGIIVPPSTPLSTPSHLVNSSNGNEANSKNFGTFVATKNGFTAELNRINGGSVGGLDKCEEDSLVVNGMK